MRTTTLTRTLVGLCAAAVLAPTTASAEQWVHRDATGDVVEVGFDPETEQETETPAPDDTTTDVRWVKVTHAARQLRVAMRVEDVARGPRLAVLHLRTSHGRRFEVARMRAPESSFYAITRGDGRFVRCAGKSSSMDVVTDLVSLTVPRHCLGDPDWVRVGAGYVTFSADMLDDVRADDALRRGVRDMLRMGPEVHRG